MSAVLVGLIARALGVGEGAARLIAAGLAASIALAAAWGAIAWLKRQGSHEAVQRIERMDHEAGIAANEARDRLRSCFGRGGMPDPRTGQCDR